VIGRLSNQRTAGLNTVACSIFAHIAASTCSAMSCPRLTDQSSGTRMCTDTKARLPAARVRTAWNWTSSFVKPRKTASTRAPSPSGSAIHQTTDEAPYERNRRRDDVGRDEQRDDRIEPLPAGDRHRGHADNDPDRRP